MITTGTGTEKLYRKDARFKRYVDRYCQSRGCTVKEALRHNLVIEVGEYYRNEIQQKYSTRNIDI
ncbi:MAG: hypothetical protein NC416_08135 [Eubacterium sp.]|nr:hypothetical protein [Eubacterium sp.]